MNINSHSFIKFQGSSILATLLDYLVFYLSVEFFGVVKWKAVPFGALSGAILNFYLNKKYVFKSERNYFSEVVKYIVISSGSLVLNTLLFKLLYKTNSVHYMYWRVGISFLVSIIWNYPFQKFWVFSKGKKG